MVAGVPRREELNLPMSEAGSPENGHLAGAISPWRSRHRWTMPELPEKPPSSFSLPGVTAPSLGGEGKITAHQIFRLGNLWSSAVISCYLNRKL